MTGLLVKFGTIMFVVMLGFAMSFYSLFREARSYGQVWLEPRDNRRLPEGCRDEERGVGEGGGRRKGSAERR